MLEILRKIVSFFDKKILYAFLLYYIIRFILKLNFLQHDNDNLVLKELFYLVIYYVLIELLMFIFEKIKIVSLKICNLISEKKIKNEIKKLNDCEILCLYMCLYDDVNKCFKPNNIDVEYAISFCNNKIENSFYILINKKIIKYGKFTFGRRDANFSDYVWEFLNNSIHDNNIKFSSKSIITFELKNGLNDSRNYQKQNTLNNCKVYCVWFGKKYEFNLN